MRMNFPSVIVSDVGRSPAFEGTCSQHLGEDVVHRYYWG